jgi:hypothetical protein
VAWLKRNIFRKYRNQGKCGPRKELAAAGRKVTRRAGVARRKGNFVRKHSTRESVEEKTQKERTEEKRGWKDPEFKTGIKESGTGRKLLLKIEKT